VQTLQISYEKNGFAEVSKNLVKYRSNNNFVYCQNNYVRRSTVMSNAAKNFDFLTISLNVLHNYFDVQTKLIG